MERFRVTNKQRKVEELKSAYRAGRRNRRSEDFDEIKQANVIDIYSAIAAALWDVIDGSEQDKEIVVRDVFVRSQELWIETVSAGRKMSEVCKEITGLDLEYKEPEN